MKIALAQPHFSLGDFDENCKKLLEILKTSIKGGADLLAFPEGGLWSYPPKDFLYQDHLFKIQEQKIQLIRKRLKGDLILLLPAFVKDKTGSMQNGVFLLKEGQKSLFFAKEFLPDQGVFFESRYFKKGVAKDNFFYWKKHKIRLLICEDLWHFSPDRRTNVLIALNASPWTDQKQRARLRHISQLAQKSRAFALYLNVLGARDGLIFDGSSFALKPEGDIIWQGEAFQPDFKILELPLLAKPSSAQVKGQKKLKANNKRGRFLNLQEQRERAIVLGIRDFFAQTGFSKACLGLSGGIDSALTAYLAVQALGCKNVEACFFPSSYTSDLSRKLAYQLSISLKIPLLERTLDPLPETFWKWLFGVGEKKGRVKAPLNPFSLQNIQSRLRGMALMALSNESSSLLLATANKSELAVGYATIYGDLAGALCPIGDLLKSQVYDLARHIHKKNQLFPKALFSKAPSAELAPGQKDSDDLPPYPILDPLLEKFFKGMEPKSLLERKLLDRIQKQEFKRHQAPLILKLSEMDLAESWRRPIAHKFPLST